MRTLSSNGIISKTGIGHNATNLSIRSLCTVRLPINPASLRGLVRAFSRTEATMRFAANNASKPLSVIIIQ